MAPEIWTGSSRRQIPTRGRGLTRLPGAAFPRKLGEGTFALQAHDPKSVVRYRNIRVKRLAD